MRSAILHRFDDFDGLDRDALTTVAQHARLLRFPADRLLVRPAANVRGRYYLFRGCVRVAGTGEFGDSDVRARARLLPAVGDVHTTTPCVLVHVDWEPIAFLVECRRASYVKEDLAGWQETFLNSAMMQSLTPLQWQAILSRMRRRRVCRGEHVVRVGEPGETGFVLTSGRAVITRGKRVLSVLQPGHFFGEDAVVTGRRRNATVTMLEDGAVGYMARRELSEIVRIHVKRIKTPEARMPLIYLGPGRASRSMNIPLVLLRQHLDQLDARQIYGLVALHRKDTWLANLVLAQAQLDGRAVDQAGTVLPSAQVRKLLIDSACSTDMG